MVVIVLVKAASELTGFGAVPFRALRLLLLYNNNNISSSNRGKEFLVLLLVSTFPYAADPGVYLKASF